jgi:hypothetical protein
MSELKVEDVERHFAQLAELEKEFDQVDIEICKSLSRCPLFSLILLQPLLSRTFSTHIGDVHHSLSQHTDTGN